MQYQVLSETADGNLDLLAGCFIDVFKSVINVKLTIVLGDDCCHVE